MLYLRKCLQVVFLLIATGYIAFAQIRLPPLISDGMVLQRDTKLRVWGWAAKGEAVSITFNKRTFKAVADADGLWSVWLPPLKAGGPYVMNISGSNTIQLKNILVGDVWLCSGQSNMVHYLDLHKERYADEINRANFPQIRQFLVPIVTSLQTRENDLPSGNWNPATPEHIGRFSVVAYFFAKQLHEKYKIPIGIINASVGGSPIEAWMSEEAISGFPGLSEVMRKNSDTSYVGLMLRTIKERNKEITDNRPQDPGMSGLLNWYDTSYVTHDWNTFHIPGYWEDQGHKNLDGVVWFKREIDIPASMCGVAADIALGRIIDADHLYINGMLAGQTGYQYPQRRYRIPSGVLRPGKNVFVIRVVNYAGKGGFVPGKPYTISANGKSLDLTGPWQFKIGAVYPAVENPVPGFQLQNQPAALFNGMISPFTRYAIKGMVWYQGESNAGRPAEYRKLLPALIQDWRKQWEHPDKPFLFVQLPNFMEVDYYPSESNWAELREAQLNALTVPHTAMAVAIDLGEWNDIHPGNKKPIGERLALQARKIAYGEKELVSSGPLFESFHIEGNSIIFSFTNTGSGLITIDGEVLKQFSIAGADKRFVWASAKIVGSNVVVSSDQVSDPRFVRYAWSDNPDGANLYNKEGLPASPFRTDQ